MVFGRFLDPHLSDERLAAVSLAARGTGAPAPRRARAHLDACAACRARLDGVRRGLDAIAARMEAELDAAFPPDRLARQREQILRRIERSQRPARVLTFPYASPSPTPRRHASGRWIAAAAAVGLLVGATLGRVAPPVEIGSGTTTADRAAVSEPVDAAAFNEEEFLFEIDTALERVPRVAELEALDALTPQILDVAFSSPQ